MRSVTILFCSIFISCVQLQVLFPSSSTSEPVPDYRQLKIYYSLAFEKQMSIDYTALNELVSRMQLALDNGKLTAAQQMDVRRWQHKLRSFISFAMSAKQGRKEEALIDTLSTKPYRDMTAYNARLAAEEKIMGNEQVRGLGGIDTGANARCRRCSHQCRSV